MKKVLSILLIIVLVLSMCSCGDTTTSETQQLIFAHIFATGSMEDEAANMFAKAIEEKTNGAYKVTVYPAGQMGSMAEIIEQQQTKAAHFQIISTTALASIADVAAIDSWPYIFDSREEFEKAYASDAGKGWLAQVEEATGFKLIAPMYKGFRQIFINYDADSLSDLEGCKLRVPGFDTVLSTFKNWGISPTPMSTSEVYTAMQQNVVEGMEIELSTAYSMGLADVTETIIMSNHMACNYAFLIYGDYYDSLPDNVKNVIQEAGAEAAQWLSDEVEADDAEALAGFKESGVNVITPDMTEWKKIADEKLAEEYPEYNTIAVKMREAGKN